IAPPGTSDPPPGSPAAGPGHTNTLADGGLNPDQAAMDATGTSKEGARPLAALSAFRNLSASTGQLLARAESALRAPDAATLARAAAQAVAPGAVFAGLVAPEAPVL